MGSWVTSNLGEADFAAFVLDTGSIATPAPTSVPIHTQAPDTEASPSFSPAPVAGETQPSERTHTQAPTENTDTPLSRTKSSPTPVIDGDPFNVTLMVAGLCGVVFLVVVVCAGWLCRRRFRRREEGTASPVIPDARSRGDGADSNSSHVLALFSEGLPSRRSVWPQRERGYSVSQSQQKGAATKATSLAPFGTSPGLPDDGEGKSVEVSLQPDDSWRQVGGETGNGGNTGELQPSISVPTRDGAGAEQPADVGDAPSPTAESSEGRTLPIGGCRKKVRGVRVASAVLEVAHELAELSPFPGVKEVARVVIILVNLVTDKSDMNGAADNTVKRCASVMRLLQLAARVFEKVSRVGSGHVCNVLHM